MSTATLDLTDSFVLGRDVTFTKVADLPEEVRSRLKCEEDDVAITQSQERQPTRVVDLDLALLLEAFRSPCRIVDAVIAFSRARAQDPEQVLERAYPALCGFIGNGLLRPPGANGDAAQEGWVVGDMIGPWTIRRRLRMLADTEVHQVTLGDLRGALKIAGREAPTVAAMLGHEAEVLNVLSGTAALRLLDQGTFQDRPFIVTEWCAGVPVAMAGEELRSQGDRAGLLSLSRRVLRAYTAIHERGVFHGDIHPENVLVQPDGEVRLIDFGLAHRSGQEAKGRGGVGFYLEPECVKASLSMVRPPAPSERGEQYSLAALLHVVVTGAPYLEFSLQREQGLRQIVEDDPLPFAQRGLESWPQVEAALARALRKDPLERFPSVDAFEKALAEAEKGAAPAARRPAYALVRQAKEGVLRAIGPEGSTLRDGPGEAPLCSFNHGATGIAYALYRMAILEESAPLLQQAERWIHWARAHAADPEAFENAALDVVPRIIGEVTPFHTMSGVWATQALIAHAAGNHGGFARGVKEFLEQSRKPSENPDLTLGYPGSLLMASRLRDLGAPRDGYPAGELEGLGEDLAARAAATLRSFAAVREEPRMRYLGMAHGWAGLLYALMTWYGPASATKVPDLETRLDQLAACAVGRGRGLQWPSLVGAEDDDSAYLAGWCNGSAGFCHLWQRAYAALGSAKYLELAEKAAWNVWEEPHHLGSLCCGLVGRAYALLGLLRLTGEGIWRHRARVLADRAAISFQQDREHPFSLFKGVLGLALLASELEAAERDSSAEVPTLW